MSGVPQGSELGPIYTISNFLTRKSDCGLSNIGLCLICLMPCFVLCIYNCILPINFTFTSVGLQQHASVYFSPVIIRSSMLAVQLSQIFNFVPLLVSICPTKMETSVYLFTILVSFERDAAEHMI